MLTDLFRRNKNITMEDKYFGGIKIKESNDTAVPKTIQNTLTLV
jgi:hypothetical protein